MISGFHSHYCPRCKCERECLQITHCCKPDTALCADCFYDDYLAKSQQIDRIDQHEGE